ncbi:MAG: HAD hydrolase family protein [Clostridia bacterium]|nr:HAD hydrolase family protein [Clostridia bacterium]
MGKFDGILIATDWDGTVYVDGEVSLENREAIEYFKSEGGFFTISSGRKPSFLSEMAAFVKPNTYATCMNGCLLADIDSGAVVRERCADEGVFSAVCSVLDCGADIKQVNVFTREVDNILHYTPEEFKKAVCELKSLHIYKISLSANGSESGEMMAAYAREHLTGDYTMVRSSVCYGEILKRECLKGEAVRALKEMTGARLLVGVGNFENDASLLSAADIGYAVGDAIESLKKIADRVTVPARESAIKKIIEDLENS